MVKDKAVKNGKPDFTAFLARVYVEEEREMD